MQWSGLRLPAISSLSSLLAHQGTLRSLTLTGVTCGLAGPVVVISPHKLAEPNL
jgi:hypothetical protein